MSRLTWNIRGACNSNKKKDIKKRIIDVEVSMEGIIETKFENVMMIL